MDWRALRTSQEEFAITREIVGGNRTQYPVCRVSKVDPNSDADGKHMLDVEVVALGEKPL